jgi:hypothetical protein
MDLSTLSDADLMAALGGSGDLSSMSDEDLMAALNGPASPQTAEGFAPRSVREAEPSREQMKGAYEEIARGERDRQGPIEQFARTVGRGLTRAFPLADDLAAAGNTLGGMAGTQPERSFDENLLRQRGYNAADDTDRPVQSIGGQLAGSLALPMPGAGALKGLAAGAGYGAAYGLGSGDDLEDRLSRGVTGGAVGGAIGGAMGGLASKLAPSAAPQATGNPAVEAGNRIGQPIPRFLAAEDMIVPRVAQGISNIPIVGNSIVKARDATLQGLGSKVDDLAKGLGGETVEGAGTKAGKALDDWIGPASKAKEKAAYDAVDNLVNPQAQTALAHTKKVVADIQAKRQNAKIAGSSKAANEVEDAINAPGLNYEGVKNLRTHIGEMLNGGKLPEGMSQGELKTIYKSLSSDLREAVKAGGGTPALKAFERANTGSRLINDRRERLTRIVGNRTDASPAQVFDRLTAAAGGTTRADTRLLLEAKRSMPKEDWDGVVGAVIGRLGKDAEGNFSPDRFITDFDKKLSDTGRRVLFGKDADALRKTLSDIETISSQIKGQNRFGNPSGTGQTLSSAFGGAALYADPIGTIGVAIGGAALAKILSRPASAKAVGRYARVVEKYVKSPSRASAAMVEREAGLLARVANDNGVRIDPSQLLGGLRSASGGEGQQEEQNRRQ